MLSDKKPFLFFSIVTVCAISGVFGALPFLITTATALLATGVYLKISNSKKAIKQLKENESKAIHFEDYEPNTQENIPTKTVKQDGLEQYALNIPKDKNNNEIEK